MATHYIDPIGGSDAANGLSFANRKKTLASVSGLAAGDSIRIIESPARTSLGSCTWTDTSRTITLASAKTLEIDPCTAAWTASANITTSANTTRKYGSTSSRFVAAAGFTTGKVAYKALAGTVDCSAYTGVSFWLYVTANSFGGQNFTLNLCSDATGDVVVNAIQINFGQTTNVTGSVWCPVFLDTGGALGSTINSISITAAADPGSVAFQINNLMACKGLTDADHLSLRSVIGKDSAGEPLWYPINSINGTTLTIGSYNSTQAALGRAYRGTSESVTTYARAHHYTGWSAAQRTLPNVSGTEASPITISGGWDSSAMSSQSGETWWSGMGYLTSPMVVGGRDWLNISVDAFCAFQFALEANQSENCDISTEHTVGLYEAQKLNGEQQSGGCRFYFGHISFPDGILYLQSASAPLQLEVGRIAGSNTSPAWSPGRQTSDVQPLLRHQLYVRVRRIENCLLATSIANYSNTEMSGCEFEFNTTDVQADASVGGSLFLHNPQFLGGAPVLSSTPITSAEGLALYMTGVNGDITDNRIYQQGINLYTQSSVVPTGATKAWAFEPKSTVLCTSRRPGYLSLSRIACASGELRTITLWVRRSSTSLTIGMLVRGGQIPGVAEDVSAAITVGADTWEQISLSFTPTADGIVEVLGFAYGGTTLTGYLGLLEYS